LFCFVHRLKWSFAHKCICFVLSTECNGFVLFCPRSTVVLFGLVLSTKYSGFVLSTEYSGFVLWMLWKWMFWFSCVHRVQWICLALHTEYKWICFVLSTECSGFVWFCFVLATQSTEEQTTSVYVTEYTVNSGPGGTLSLEFD